MRVEREEDASTRLAVVEIGDPWPRRLAVEHGDLEPHGDEGEAVVSPDGTEVAYTFTPRADLNRSEIRVAAIDGGQVRALTGTPRMHDRSRPGRPTARPIAYASERSGFYELHLVGRDGEGERQITTGGADYTEHAWHPDGSRLLAVQGDRNRFHLVTVDARRRQRGDARPGRVLGDAVLDGRGDIVAGPH